ncbi:SDR family NAD(P)-dependent oxidoreductase [Blastomonas sp.]|uniref:SDR family NAD(P)-dependent oxidoreductase n=1 Tax=Blastomonas sp. TaxID=1909299 RepID=UPI00406A3273
MAEHRMAGRTVIITGGSSGIGAAMVARFAQQHAFVLIADLKAPTSEGLVRLLDDGQAAFVRTDVSNEASIADCVAQALQASGRIDCLINNAGVFDPTPDTVGIVAADADRLFRILLLGPMLMARQVIPVMRRQGGGAIINTTSVTGVAPSGGSAVYGPLKAGLIHWTRCAALELARDKIRVNAVCPGGVLTPMIMPAFGIELDDVSALAQAGEAIGATQPLGRIGTPDDIASAALYLASDEASWVTGQNLVVDGGWTLAPGRGQ